MASQNMESVKVNTFHLFPHLPAELRRTIFEYALPKKVKPFLRPERENSIISS
jgi:hypothetical protein